MTAIERIALFDLEFEGIHPFIDGNGRTGRLILNLDLIRNGYPPINVKFTDRKRYYEAFDLFYRDKADTVSGKIVFTDFFGKTLINYAIIKLSTGVTVEIKNNLCLCSERQAMQIKENFIYPMLHHWVTQGQRICWQK